jgi:hypothetical protein
MPGAIPAGISDRTRKAIDGRRRQRVSSLFGTSAKGGSDPGDARISVLGTLTGGALARLAMAL